MANSGIRDRIERMRNGGLDGPSPNGFLLSVSNASSNALLIVHDLGLAEEAIVTILADGQSVRLSCDGAIVLQTADANGEALRSLLRAPLIEVLETSEGEPLRLHTARIGC